MNINEVIKLPEYIFLKENEHIKDKLLFLSFGGSHSYGTNVETSDVDIRGCALNSVADILGLSNFEHFRSESTDTVVYGFNKFVRLLIDCNPSIIEMLGCKPDHYIFFNNIGRQLVENRKLFLSQKAVSSFGGYANQQLRRLECAIAHDRVTEEEHERHLIQSMTGAVNSFRDRYTDFEHGSLKLFVDKSDKTNRNTEVFADIVLNHYPARDFNGILNELGSVVRTYDKLNARNNKKDDAHLNKHAMHLIRLYLMCFDILEKEDIYTYRENDREMLLEIRNGKYMNEDGTYMPEFFELVNEYEKRLDYAKKNTSLPVKPNMEQIEEFVIEVNRKAIGG